MDDTRIASARCLLRFIDFRGDKGRAGWKYCHGCLGRDLRNCERPWDVVSDQSIVGWIFPGANRHRANRCLSLGRPDRGDRRPLLCSLLVGLLLWSRASDVSTEPRFSLAG